MVRLGVCPAEAPVQNRHGDLRHCRNLDHFRPRFLRREKLWLGTKVGLKWGDIALLHQKTRVLKPSSSGLVLLSLWYCIFCHSFFREFENRPRPARGASAVIFYGGW